ncbi:Phospholipase A2-beta [Raphanus sativus]|uniref:phospholipase A2 n=1 Tax=Raphanus sativus TaxID=3726 RepID=A0A6J0L426_RAPSA|nr:phospholipase A2-beta-like [Raphanus sativus]KAJ4876985.1 Phospholipase A2-beta [Raphanus sativus]
MTMLIRFSLMRFVEAALFVALFLFDVGRTEECTRTCIAQNCDTLSIRYGKYCGIGHFGCPGEEPCDDLDACCMAHDNCVDSKGMTNISCHKKFKQCLNRLSKSIKQSKNKKVGFSKQCPYSQVIPTMNQGMDIGIMFSQLGNDLKTEL